MKNTFCVEFLLAWDDGTWTTDFFDVPITLDGKPDDEINIWWYNNHLGNQEYRKLVLAAIYNISQEDYLEEEEEEEDEFDED